MVQASLRQRVLCHGRAVAACWFRQEAACLPVSSPLAPGWPISRTLSSLAALPMQHHNSQASSLSAAMTCQPRLPFAAQVGLLRLPCWPTACNASQAAILEAISDCLGSIQTQLTGVSEHPAIPHVSTNGSYVGTLKTSGLCRIPAPSSPETLAARFVHSHHP